MRLRLLGLLFAATLTCHAADTGEPSPAVVSVTGTGAVTAVPNMALVTVGVTSQESGAAGAVAANNRSMAALNKALDAFDIAERDRRSSGFSVQPRYDHRRNPGGMPEIIGYTVSNRVTIRIRDLDSVGDVLGAVIDSGGNTIDSLQFGNEDVDELLDEARQLAIKNARHKAELYAAAASVKVGRVISIAEGGAAAVPRPQLRGEAARIAMSADLSPVPIAAGENEFKATINVVYELEQ